MSAGSWFSERYFATPFQVSYIADTSELARSVFHMSSQKLGFVVDSSSYTTY